MNIDLNKRLKMISRFKIFDKSQNMKRIIWDSILKKIIEQLFVKKLTIKKYWQFANVCKGTVTKYWGIVKFTEEMSRTGK